MVIYVPAAWEEARHKGISAWKSSFLTLMRLRKLLFSNILHDRGGEGRFVDEILKKILYNLSWLLNKSVKAHFNINIGIVEIQPFQIKLQSTRAETDMTIIEDIGRAGHLWYFQLERLFSIQNTSAQL